MAGDFISRYARFDGGDWGNRDPARARDYQFYGENVVVYDSELLGPRPGLAKLNTSALNHTIVNGPLGFDIWQDKLVLVLDQPYICDIPASKTDGKTWRSPTPATFTQGSAIGFARMAEFARNLYINVDGYLYKISASGEALTQITTPQPIQGVQRWGYYLVAWDVNVKNRLWYSLVDQSGANPDSWGVNQFLDVGGNEPITALMPLYNYLYVGKESGWYAVSGILADRPFVRRATIGNGPINDRVCTATADSRILYWGQGNVPMWFNGESSYMDKEFRVKNFDIQYPCDAVVASITNRRNIMLGEPADEYASEADAATRMLLFDDGAWTTHSFNVALGGVAGHDPRTTIDKPPDKMFFVNRSFNVNDPVEVYVLDLELNRPARDTDDWADVDDQGTTLPLTGYVEFPAFYDPQSRFVKVRNVVVQLRHWPSEVADSVNELQLQIRPLGRYEGQPIDGQLHTWTMPAARARTNGSNESWRIGVGDIGWSNGFQIVLPHVHGVEIRSIEAHCEVRSARL